MYWPFKTTAKFVSDDSRSLHVEYAVSAVNMMGAKSALERRFKDQEEQGCTIVKVVACTTEEAATLNLPLGSIQLLGYDLKHGEPSPPVHGKPPCKMLRK